MSAGRFKLQPDRSFYLDVGVRQEMVKLLMNYHPSWLQLALETLHGAPIIVATDDNRPKVLAKWIERNVLFSVDIAARHSVELTADMVDSLPFRQDLGNHTLTFILKLLYFLDVARPARLIAEPCLYRKSAPIKSSKDVLIKLSPFFANEGSVLKHVASLGFPSPAQQTMVDEFDCRVKDLGTDMRDRNSLCSFD